MFYKTIKKMGETTTKAGDDAKYTIKLSNRIVDDKVMLGQMAVLKMPQGARVKIHKGLSESGEIKSVDNGPYTVRSDSGTMYKNLKLSQIDLI